MVESDRTEAEFQLGRLFREYSDTVDYHRWPAEDSRWAELVIALLSRINVRHRHEVREIVEKLHEFDLLDIDGLAEIGKENSRIDLKSMQARRIEEILSDFQFTGEESKKSILVMHEAAKSLKERFGGKIQGYLRKYGELMMDELPSNFSFSKMSESDVRYAFTFWLQNVLNMPISLEDKSVKEFCDRLGITPKELVKEADRLGINVALVDDLIQKWNLSRKSKG